MSKFKALVALAMCFACTSPVAAESGSEALDRFLATVDTLSASFAQQQFDEDGEILASSSGQMQIARPERFRWNYQAPYEQLVVSDGLFIWIYDPDLEQVTRRPVAQALSGSPAALLSRDRAALNDFVVESSIDESGLAMVRLTPRSAESDFRSIRLWLSDAVPVKLEFSDQLGGTTRIVLSGVRANPVLAPNAFEFKPPKGVEVVDG